MARAAASRVGRQEQLAWSVLKEAPAVIASRKELLILIAGTAWLLVVAAGMTMLWGYSTAPGIPGAPPHEWPRESRIRPSPDLATLILMAHPRCPCTRASIGELDRLMARVEGRLAAYVLFVTPMDAPAGWERTDLWRSAAAIPGVVVVRDADGAEARRFNSPTSGQVIVYDAAGKLRFSGGITPARGHAGDNLGLSEIVALVEGESPTAIATPVFGCSLLESQGS